MRRTLITLLLIIFVPLLLVQVGIYYAWFEAQRRSNALDNLETARAVSETLGAVIRDAASHELALGSVILLSEPNTLKVEKLLKISAEEDKTIHSFNWVLPDGRVAITSEANTTVASIQDSPYFQQVLTEPNAVVSDFLPEESLSGLPAITISRSIRNEQGLLQGIVVGVVTEEEFHNVIAPLKPSTISSILIFDHHGTLIYRWPEATLGLKQRTAWVGIDPALRSALVGKDATGVLVSPINGETEVTARTPVGNTGMVVGVARAEGEIILPIFRNIIINLAIVLLIMLFSLVMAGIISRKIFTSILHLREHSRAIGKGELEHRANVGGITELQELADEFNQMALQLKDRNIRIEQTLAALKRSNEDLEQFAYVASHDLQEPLRAVSGFVELLKLSLQDTLDAKKTEYMNFITDGVGRMQSLIKGLLEYSRIDTSGKAPKPADSRVALDHAISHLEASIKESGAKVTYDNLPTVYFDALQLTQLFQNLIGNAIKFHGKQPPLIQISAVRKDDIWQFAVTDNGIGIEMQYSERIFQIFQRLHTTQEYPGTGIGLAICKKIIERHGGKIRVESQPEHGSTFYFTIPDTDRKEV